MFSPKATMFVILDVALMIIAPFVNGQETTQADRDARYTRYWNAVLKVKGGLVTPHWLKDGSFWYADNTPDSTIIYRVNPNTNTKTELFDIPRLRKALATLLNHEPPYHGLPFEDFTFVDDAMRVLKFQLEKKDFILNLDNYTLTSAISVPDKEKNRLVPREVRQRNPLYEPGQILERLSPDKRWFATLRDHNLWLRSTYEDSLVQITKDGKKNYEWGFDFVWTEQEWAWWSPDNSSIAVKRVDYRKVDKIPIVDWLKTPETIEEIAYDYPGGAFPNIELFIVDIRTKQQVRVKTPLTAHHLFFVLGWRPGGEELLFFRIDREYKTWELMAADKTTGAVRKIFSETGSTFVGQPVWAARPGFHLLKTGSRFIWRSERDGWAHLYLYDINGKLIRQLTKGAFPIDRIITVDEEGGWVYFTAHGDLQRPYDTHLYRVSLEGKNFTRLTVMPGQHSVEFTPSNKFFINTHSSLDRPPVVELCKADGTILQVLSKANIASLSALNWRPPEEFKVKAADGITDLYGVIYKPLDYDSGKKYPVIETIYGAPNSTSVGWDFRSGYSMQHRAELGFIVFAVDARGTPKRGKRFLDVVFRNMGRYEIPDHVAALKQVAEKRPYMDLTRVGITGGSAGGYFTIRALLQAPDVYHVGVARASQDARFSVVEPYMGLPENNSLGYDYASNVNLAQNLKGKLLLIHGTHDKNTPVGPIMKFVDEFVRANKPFDLLLLPGQGHGFTGPGAKHAGQATRNYFLEHLKPEW